MGGNYFTEYLPPSKHWLIWDKCNPNLSFSEAEVAWVYDGKLMRIFKHYSARIDGEVKIHPTQKPIALYRWILTNYANAGDKILDTHVGSASSLIACEDMGFKYVGFELDEDYYRMSSERIKRHKAQVSIMELMNDWRMP